MPGPVLYIDDRWLYGELSEVPVEPFRVADRRGRGAAARVRCYVDRDFLDGGGVRAGGWDAGARGDRRRGDRLADLKPWDKPLVAASVSRTGRAVVADGGWRTAGASADIAAEITERCFHDLMAPVRGVTLPDAPAPASRAEERAYYPGAEQIASAARVLVRRDE